MELLIEFLIAIVFGLGLYFILPLFAVVLGFWSCMLIGFVVVFCCVMVVHEGEFW